MKKIQIPVDEITDGIYSSIHDDWDIYIITRTLYPFTNGFLTLRDRNKKYDTNLNIRVGDLIMKNKLYKYPYYLIGDISEKFMIVKFVNNFYCIFSKSTPFKVINDLNLPDELFTL